MQLPCPVPALRATFLGTTTISFDDGQDSILIDGFFSRPSLLKCLFWYISSDQKSIELGLQAAGIKKESLRAVLVFHTHYDHALDAAPICQQTSATLYGSESTRMVGLGHALCAERIEVIKDGDVLRFGEFRVTVFEGKHSPGDRFPGIMQKPLATPCRASEFKTGECFSWLIEHGVGQATRRVFVHPSANYIRDKFVDVGRVDVLFLGVGVVAKQDDEFRHEYWTHTVGALKPKRIIPIHWDNLWSPIATAPEALPYFDNWDITQKWLGDRCRDEEVELDIPEWASVYDLSA
jgi:L-ascorbate metabolism protein UlaG (beta-lactamase superfamily)